MYPATLTKPTVGRTVQYYAYGTPGGEFPAGVARAAIITEVIDENKGIVAVCVLNPSGLFFNTNIEYSDSDKPGCWGWPPRV